MFGSMTIFTVLSGVGAGPGPARKRAWEGGGG